MDDKSIALIEDFQIYAGKRVHTYFFFYQIPKYLRFLWSWMDTTYDKVDDVYSSPSHPEEPSRLIFCNRTEEYMTDPEKGRENAYGCVVYDLLNVAEIFGMLGYVVNMVRMGHFWPTDEWKKRVWKRAWVLDECFWRLQAMDVTAV